MIKVKNQVPEFKVPRKILKKTINAILKHEDFKKTCEVSLLFTTNPHIKKLNKIYRGKNTPTDVLAFSMIEGVKLKCPPETIILGDIIISVTKAKEQAKGLGHSLLKEVVWLFIHGMLHLLNYKDTSCCEQNLMGMRQAEIFNKIFKRKRTKSNRIKEE